MNANNTSGNRSPEQQFNAMVTHASLSLRPDGGQKSKHGFEIKDVTSGDHTLKPSHRFVQTRDLLQTVNHYLLHDRFELKQKKTSHNAAPLIIFLIDSSSSMAKNKMIAYVKGLIENTAKKHNRQSLKYALIALLQGESQLIFPPGKSKELLFQSLEDLKTGGQTNMASGIRKVYEVIRKQKGSDIVKLFILTDGKINKGKTSTPFEEAVQLHKQLLGSLKSVTVVDTESGFVKLQMAKDFANSIKANYKTLEI
ncbi:VWA domain-containing protein [Fulvivirga ulvae]|uniref:VWA domain-containing protein n=1 Tax=Fulvivirga ulvae TaxID=2904245 RepID=UPI001F1FAECF|nr:VWA domain-containing protein [Fulvivirga ulvae]UII33992.1 VWA domain-containing protein [Fulvivirga ulvae]